MISILQLRKDLIVRDVTYSGNITIRSKTHDSSWKYLFSLECGNFSLDYLAELTVIIHNKVSQIMRRNSQYASERSVLNAFTTCPTWRP